MPADNTQIQMIRRYSRILREQQALHRGPRIGARERRSARETARQVAESATRRALDAVRPPSPPADRG